MEEGLEIVDAEEGGVKGVREVRISLFQTWRYGVNYV